MIRIFHPIYGVPITYLGCHCVEQFKIIGCPHADLIPIGWKGMTENFLKLYYKQGNTGSYKVGNRLESFIDSNGLAKIPYARILIQKL